LIQNNIEKIKYKKIIAEIHVEYNEIDLALKNYEEILELYPGDIDIKKRLVELYKMISDYDSIISFNITVLDIIELIIL